MLLNKYVIKLCVETTALALYWSHGFVSHAPLIKNFVHKTLKNSKQHCLYGVNTGTSWVL